MIKVFGSFGLAIGVIALMLFGSVSAWAKGPQGVIYSKHNLSTTSPLSAYRTNEDEVCIFCHTPHGGTNNTPLWNHPFSEGATDLTTPNYFAHYNSATLSSDAFPDGHSSRSLNSESLMCMSCHDGSIAATRVLNTSNDLPDTGAGLGQPTVGGVTSYIPEVLPGGAKYPANIGNYPGQTSNQGDLRDDHPVSFSYYDAWNDPNEDELVHPNTLVTNQQLGTVDTPEFFGVVAEQVGGMLVECSTCHDPHVMYETALNVAADPAYTPFLVMPNSGSQMCFACHVK